MVAHKIAPAIATGNPIVLKPTSKISLSAIKLAKIIEETDWPKHALKIVVTDRQTEELLVTDSRFAMFSFTGSPQVGWAMKERDGPRKKVVLELGGNAGLIIDKSANIPYAIKRTLTGAFSFAGQSCISVQQIYIHKDIFDKFANSLVKKVKKLTIGDPLDPTMDIGPMIDDKAAIRTKKWVEEAVTEGGKILVGGKSLGRIFEPTVLTNIKPGAKVCNQEKGIAKAQKKFHEAGKIRRIITNRD